MASYSCKWADETSASKCQQQGQAPPKIRSSLLHEMRKIGLPDQMRSKVFFTLWRVVRSGDFVTDAYYQQTDKSELTLCQVIAVLDGRAGVTLLRKIPFQKTDADVPTITQWSLIDVADVDGDGKPDVILQADSYENHWLEVDELQGLNWKTVFSGLGYYL